MFLKFCKQIIFLLSINPMKILKPAMSLHCMVQVTQFHFFPHMAQLQYVLWSYKQDKSTRNWICLILFQASFQTVCGKGLSQWTHVKVKVPVFQAKERMKAKIQSLYRNKCVYEKILVTNGDKVLSPWLQCHDKIMSSNKNQIQYSNQKLGNVIAWMIIPP